MGCPEEKYQWVDQQGARIALNFSLFLSKINQFFLVTGQCFKFAQYRN
jgi:hypothetical protein